MSAENEKFPRVGVYLLIKTSEKKVLVRNHTHSYGLPFALFQGGETWDELVLELKKICGIPKAQHTLIGSGVAPLEHTYPLVYCVFQVLLTPSQKLEPDSDWSNWTEFVSVDPISSWICEKFGATLQVRESD